MLGTALPTRGELPLVLLTTFFAAPALRRAFVQRRTIDQFHRTFVIEVIDDPQLHPRLRERHISQDAAEMLIPNFAGDPFRGQDVAKVVNRDQCWC